jgi:thioredoxin reductase (NADPH)
MVERVRPFGQEKTFAENVLLYTYGERGVDMFVVLAGHISMSLPAAGGESKIIAHHQTLDFSGELNLLNSQGSLVEARTVQESRLLRIPRSGLQRLMRAEGDIANLIMQATIWRRIAIINEAGGGIVLQGPPGDAETIQLQRFLLRNTYPHRIVETKQEESPQVGDYRSSHESTLPAVVLSDGRT